MMRIALAVFCILGAATGFPKGSPKADVCGYQSCPTPLPGKLNVHLVPHTHDDVGWLKTVDQYYYGSRNNIQNAGVQYILDSVVDALSHDPAKKFIYVETAFFWKWWVEQSPETQDLVKGLVANGQLEFIGGAWSMNDEATTHYQSIIDNFTWGLRKLNDTFGTCGNPRIGWQIDPFGHSREGASMMAQMGFDGLFFGRLDYQDKNQRLQDKTMEMIWEASESLGERSNIFTGALYNGYGAPPGFCYDILCGDEPIVDGQSYDNNVKDRVEAFLNFVKEQSRQYLTSNIVLTMGGDFNYQDAQIYYKNMDKLIRYVNERQAEGSDVNVFYSTPSCYLKSLHESNITWPTKSDDFFPYASDPNSYWTGYFTSRPALKYYERRSNNMLQMCKQLAAISNADEKQKLLVDPLREVMGVMQHHDAVAGTEKQHVAEDYARLLTDAVKSCGMGAATSLGTLMDTGKEAPPLMPRSCPLSNVSQCDITQNNDKTLVTIYNPLSRLADLEVRLPVNGDSAYSVIDASGNDIGNQVTPVPESILNIPGRTATTDAELVFGAGGIPPLGYKSYYIEKTDQKKPSSFLVNVQGRRSVLLEGTGVTAKFNERGVLTGLGSGKAEVSWKPGYYIGALGDNSDSKKRSSGAYIFRPNGSDVIDVNMDKASVKVYQGELMYEIHQTYSESVSLVVKIPTKKLADDKALEGYELEWVIGPIDTDDNQGKEYIVRYSSDIKNDGKFYTDSNGRGSIERKRNYRPTWNLEVNEPVAGNYYPVVSNIAIRDEERELAVLTDRSEGGSSLHDGELELMVHRRLLHDDAFGVGEALDEKAFDKGLVVAVTHIVVLGDVKDAGYALEKRNTQQGTILSPEVLLTPANDLDHETLAKNYRLEFSGLTKPLPSPVQILTLEPWREGEFLFRLEHILSSDESSESVTVSLDDLFTTFTVTAARETNLAGDRWLNETTRLAWRKESNAIPHEPQPSEPRAVGEVTVKPGEIRTWVLNVQPKLQY